VSVAFFLCFIAAVLLLAYIPTAIRHDAELPISHTGKDHR
jgi:hypothetical protein